MNELNNILPYGTVVSLKEGKGKLMIIGIFQKAAVNNIVYDYSAVLLPYGYLNADDIFLFNKDKIDKIYFSGYLDEQIKDYHEDIIWANKIKGEDKWKNYYQLAQ